MTRQKLEKGREISLLFLLQSSDVIRLNRRLDFFRKFCYTFNINIKEKKEMKKILYTINGIWLFWLVISYIEIVLKNLDGAELGWWNFFGIIF